MKESGVSEKDPELQRLHQLLTNMSQQRLYQQKRAAFAQQQQQQMLNQQNTTTSAPNGANGTRTAPAANSVSTYSVPTSQPSTTSSLGPSAIPAATANTPAAKGAVQRTTASGSGYFTTEQLSILKHQIFAFKCLSKNMGIPLPTQQQLFASQQKKSPLPADQPLDTKADEIAALVREFMKTQK